MTYVTVIIAHTGSGYFTMSAVAVLAGARAISLIGPFFHLKFLSKTLAHVWRPVVAAQFALCAFLFGVATLNMVATAKGDVHHFVHDVRRIEGVLRWRREQGRAEVCVQCFYIYSRMVCVCVFVCVFVLPLAPLDMY